MIVKSYAKINLALSIVGKKDDGYHLLRMVDLPLDFHDSIEIVKTHHPSSHVICDAVGLSSLQENICTKAFKLMQKTYGFADNFDITIHKEIPFAAGLGGGSSNAACVMMAIRDMLKIKATNEELAALSVSLGADVPYFFTLKPALVEGIGEKIIPISVKKKYFALIVKPVKGCSTKEIYQDCDSYEKAPIDIDAVIRGLEEGDDALIAKSMGNDLYPAARAKVAEIDEALTALKKEGFPIVSMSGSGSSCFALTTDGWKCHEIARKLERKGYFVKITKVMK